MRIRGTKPEFWKSRRIASVSWEARLVLKGLESYVDDNGVGVDDIELIVTDIFPRDMFANPRETVARVSEAISQLHQAGLVHRYKANGDHLLFISFWEEIQRIDKPGKGRLPRPDGTFAYNESKIRESVASVPETLAPVTEEQGNRGTGEQGISLTSRTKVTSAVAKNDDPRWTASRIINGWLDTLPNRPPTKVVNDATQQVQALASEGIAVEHITAGLTEWWQGKYPATTIPNYVATAQHNRGAPRATGTQRAADILAIDTSSIPS
jgi:hypothetical protein